MENPTMERSKMRDPGEIIRDEMLFRDRIAALLREEPKTIPELAEGLNRPSHEVVFWVMAMWRYGALVPVGKPAADGYYRYQLTRRADESTDANGKKHG
jgi:hypothetical protein